jgi:hypothetical protein
VTVTAPPAWPSFDGDVALGLGEAAAELGEMDGVPLDALPATMPGGTEVASGPRISST